MEDLFGYRGKVCVVTGASSGMGKATTKLLVSLGARVFTLVRSPTGVDGIEQEVRVDLADKDSIDAAMVQLPAHIDHFFGIAGISGAKNDFVTTVKVDLLANRHICENYLTDRMDRGGSITFVTSCGGNRWEMEGNKNLYMPAIEAANWDEAVEVLEGSSLSKLPGNLGYGFAKLAMNYYVAKLQATFASKGIRVNAVLPGSTVSGMIDEFEAMAGGRAGLMAANGYATDLAVPEDVAGPVVFLGSNLAGYVSGVWLRTDFGCYAEEAAGIKSVDPRRNMYAVIDMVKQRMGIE